MNLHEYQGKEILEKFNVKVQKGYVAETLVDAINCAKKIKKETGTSIFVVKAQIHAGGRGKGGGVKIAKSLEEVKKIASEILGMKLITPQTPPEGKLVRKILIAEDVYYDGESERAEFYISVLLNRSTSKNMIIYSTEGGVDIETVAEKTPDLIFQEEVEVNSSGAISVKNPKLPKFIPKTGNPLEPNFLAVLNKVPSPPMAIIRSAFSIISLSLKGLISFNFIDEDLGKTIFKFKLSKISLTCIAICKTFSFFRDEYIAIVRNRCFICLPPLPPINKYCINCSN